MTLGAPVIDSVTRLTGTVTAEVQYLDGTSYAFVQPRVASDGTWREGQWVETGRLQSNAAAPPDDLPPPG